MIAKKVRRTELVLRAEPYPLLIFGYLLICWKHVMQQCCSHLLTSAHLYRQSSKSKNAETLPRSISLPQHLQPSASLIYVKHSPLLLRSLFPARPTPPHQCPLLVRRFAFLARSLRFLHHVLPAQHSSPAL